MSARMFNLILSEVGLLHLDCLQILLLFHDLLLNVVVVTGVALQTITVRVVLMMILIVVHVHSVIVHVGAVAVVQTFTPLSVARVVLVHLHGCGTTH